MILLCVDLLQVPHHILKAVVVPLLHVLLGSTVSNILAVLSKAMLGNEKSLNIMHLVFHMFNKLLNIGRGRVHPPPMQGVRGIFLLFLKPITSIPCQLRQPSHPPVPSLYLTQSWKPRRRTAGAVFPVRK